MGSAYRPPRGVDFTTSGERHYNPYSRVIVFTPASTYAFTLFALAHEFGHVTHGEEWLATMSSRAARERLEAEADCIGAAWMADARRRGLVTGADIEDARERHARGHGRRRIAAFEAGLGVGSGDPVSACRRLVRD
jgi:hypothetical protein